MDACVKKIDIPQKNRLNTLYINISTTMYIKRISGLEVTLFWSR